MNVSLRLLFVFMLLVLPLGCGGDAAPDASGEAAPPAAPVADEGGSDAKADGSESK